MITGDAAISKLERSFPEIADDLHEETIEGLLHCQIGEFGRFAQSQIDSQDRDAFGRICQVFVELFEDGEPALINALNVSFLEHLNFENGRRSRSWAYQFMPVQMKKAFDEMDEYNRKLHGG